MRKPFPFGIASLVVGGAMLLGAPFAVRAAIHFDEHFFPIVFAYIVGFFLAIGLAIPAFLRPRAPPPASPWIPPAPGSAPALPGFAAPPRGDRTAATAGVALAGVGCTAIAAIVFLGFLILCVAAYIVVQILRQIFAPH